MLGEKISHVGQETCNQNRPLRATSDLPTARHRKKASWQIWPHISHADATCWHE